MDLNGTLVFASSQCAPENISHPETGWAGLSKH